MEFARATRRLHFNLNDKRVVLVRAGHARLIHLQIVDVVDVPLLRGERLHRDLHVHLLLLLVLVRLLEGLLHLRQAQGVGEGEPVLVERRVGHEGRRHFLVRVLAHREVDVDDPDLVAVALGLQHLTAHESVECEGVLRLLLVSGGLFFNELDRVHVHIGQVGDL